MQETHIIQIQLSPDDLRSMIRDVVREELSSIPGTITKALATPESDRLVPRKEAMGLLGISSRTTMIELEKRGEIDPVKVGSRVSYRLSDIKSLIEKRA